MTAFLNILLIWKQDRWQLFYLYRQKKKQRTNETFFCLCSHKTANVIWQLYSWANKFSNDRMTDDDFFLFIQITKKTDDSFFVCTAKKGKSQMSAFLVCTVKNSRWQMTAVFVWTVKKTANDRWQLYSSANNFSNVRWQNDWWQLFYWFTQSTKKRDNRWQLSCLYSEKQVMRDDSFFGLYSQ